MKILTLHSSANGAPDERVSAVDLWRITRPWRELKRRVDWKIEEQKTAVFEVEKYKNKQDFTNEELEKSGEYLKQFDIIHSSYFTNPAQFALLMVNQHKHGTKFIMDIDDDMFAINPDNPFWLKADDTDVFNMQQMIRNVDYITCTTEHLANELRKRRQQKPDTVMVVPNYLPREYTFKKPQNPGKVVIGYFGGASHYRDLNETGCIEAIERIMHRHKHVEFKTVGMITDKYVPRARYEYIEGVRGDRWARELLPSLSFDIALAPLEDTIFARSKSNIKWLEATTIGAAVVASNVGPYKGLDKGNRAMLVQNDSESWEEAIEELIRNIKLRRELVENSLKDVKKNWMLKDRWQELKDVIERVQNEKVEPGSTK